MSKEFFTKVDGKMTDAPMHEEILAGGDHDAALQVTIDHIRKSGKLTEEEIELLYGKQPK